MPHVNIDVLVKCLTKCQERLYDIYIECQNVEIADAILSEQEYLAWLIAQLDKT
jgi:hypothetical protein